MRILLALYYYRPHMSGLTIYVERLAVTLARRGHTVTVARNAARCKAAARGMVGRRAYRARTGGAADQQGGDLPRAWLHGQQAAP